MRLINNCPHYSPSDLVRYLGSPYASWYDRLVLHEPEHSQCRDPEDAMSQTLARRGYAHEEGVTEVFKADGKAVAKPASKNKQEQLSETIALMRSGVDVIEQAVLTLDDITGYADFLVRVPGASNLGDWHYEVWDAKLARSVKPSFVIQLCCYTEMVHAIQGRLPESVRVALGSNETESVQLNTCYAFYQRLKQQFMQAQQTWSAATPPDPAHYRHHGNWSEQAMSVLAERDHLCFTATITRTQIKHFHVAGIETMQQLSETPLEHVPGVSPVLFDRLKVQARLQRSSAGKERPDYQLVVPGTELAAGLQLLPVHSSQDVFFDIEGFPLIEDGLEYLWGCTYFTNGGERTFLDFWAHDAAAEKRAFEDFIDWVYARWMADPSMHIYHYASYEVSACRRLMGRFGTREYELDQLLRNEVFVDLYRVVRQGLIVGEPRYSIKNIELLYRGRRETEVSGGGESIVVYENWREAFAAGEEGDCWKTSDTLKQIRDYNIDDCDSTQELVDWLRARQHEAKISYAGATDVLVPEPKAEQLAVQLLRDRLMEKSETLFDADPDKAALWQTLGGVLEFHRREAKPGFWRLFDRLGADPAELADDPDCLAHCIRTETAPFKERAIIRNFTYEYRFDADQEFRGVGKTFQLVGNETADGKSLKVELIHNSSDLENGLVALKCRQEPPDVLSLVLADFISPAPIPQAIATLVTDIEAGSGSHAAILSLLQREKPAFAKSFRQQLTKRNGAIAPSECPTEKLQQIIDAVRSLQQSCLVIQGPPGTGKTFTASRVIGQLLKDGCKVGVSSNSHAAINNLLLATAKYCSEASVDAAITCTKYTTDEMQAALVMQCTNAALVDKVQPGSLVGTTAWGFSRDDMANTLDYLFVDEAGQVALANVIGMSRSADNLVLLGDQMQLGQPTQGTHPGKSGSSVLEYLMGEQATIAEDEGVFLGTGFRMHSAVNQFISKQFYDNRLLSRPENDKRCLLLSATLESELSAAGSGVFFMPVTHAGNTQSSVEEAHRIAELVSSLLCSELQVDGGSQRPLVLNDMLFVAPYNQQVRILSEILGPDARVGSVDKFQGQEAPVVFLSLCASDASESPRGLGFLLDRHRINVAVSRAQSLVIVVGHPELVSGPVDTMTALEQANLFAALVA